jgi:hypothetical protein
MIRFVERLGIAVPISLIGRRTGCHPGELTLPEAEWWCSASHDEKLQIPRASGGVEFQTEAICDQWSRR